MQLHRHFLQTVLREVPQKLCSAFTFCVELLHESLLRAMGRDLSFQQTGFEQELNGFLVVIKSEIETVNSSLVYMNEDSTVSRSWLPESLQDVNQ